jgi:hypothetical protein
MKLLMHPCIKPVIEKPTSAFFSTQMAGPAAEHVRHNSSVRRRNPLQAFAESGDELSSFTPVLPDGIFSNQKSKLG